MATIKSILRHIRSLLLHVMKVDKIIWEKVGLSMVSKYVAFVVTLPNQHVQNNCQKFANSPLSRECFNFNQLSGIIHVILLNSFR